MGIHDEVLKIIVNAWGQQLSNSDSLVKQNLGTLDTLYAYMFKVVLKPGHFFP